MFDEEQMEQISATINSVKPYVEGYKSITVCNLNTKSIEFKEYGYETIIIPTPSKPLKFIRGRCKGGLDYENR